MMVNYVLVLIMLGHPGYKAGGYATSVVVEGFTSEQACKNAAEKLKVPSHPDLEVSYTKQCLAKDV
jgi:hypothetical protein